MENSFSVFISVGSMLVKDALAVLTNLSLIMAEKTEEPISHARGWINGQIEIALVRSY